ncbi:hypothetical protein [Aestuariimicrobium sp. T2.26MG-19.2B]|uniref:hypothetical protein n=1 Tax=Aestuariimicrobium sp. T2.26MG-19.2B TaxID=3040679 RepID=UPI0024774D34|nr:hypothetical protein [Aestuariimicrobium sp. T2.26MG-19.2B]CAI9401743.1 hypothetical protein AESSP_00654 [Aestuariimicrobium sp. T2.26MG-19.2B]
MTSFRDRLHGLTPRPPSTDDWAARAATTGRARRRTRNAAASAAAPAVVALAAVLATQYLPGIGDGQNADGRIPATPLPAGSTGPVAAPCPREASDYVDGTTITLPLGAVSLRWCTGGGDAMLSEYPPPEPLTRGLDAWVTAFNALPKLPRDAACTADWSIPGAALLTYADGTTRMVAGMRAGCGTIGGRGGFEAMRTRTIDALTAQRTSMFGNQAPPAESSQPCAAYGSTIPARLEWITGAVVCEGYPTPTAKEVASSSLPALLADLRHHHRSAGDGIIADGPTMQLLQANGEMLVLTFSLSSGVWTFSLDGAQRSWSPDEASRVAIAQASTPTTPSAITPVPPASPTIPSEGTVPACSLPASLAPASGLPSGATKVWFCSNWRFGPAEPLDTHLDEFLASTGGGIEPCLANPQDESFVAVYPDGTAVKLRMPAGACHPQPRAVTTFVRLMTEQRSAPGWTPTVVAPPQKLCAWDSWQTLMPVRLQDVTQVRFCDLSKVTQDDGSRVAGLVLKPTDAQTLLDDLATHSSPSGSTAPSAPQTTAPGVNTGRVVLALLRTNGELIWVRAMPSSTTALTWTDSAGQPMQWTPDAASAAILEALQPR